MLDGVNKYISEKNPKFPRLFRHISKELGKLKIDAFPNIDIEEIMLRKKLEDSLSNMKSVVDNDTKNKVSALFNGNLPGKMLIGQYMDLWKKYRTNTSLKLNLVENNIYRWNLKFSDFPNTSLKSSLSELQKNYGYNYIEIEIDFHEKLFLDVRVAVEWVRSRELCAPERSEWG